jgi:hypothetical protein
MRRSAVRRRRAGVSYAAPAGLLWPITTRFPILIEAHGLPVSAFVTGF